MNRRTIQRQAHVDAMLAEACKALDIEYTFAFASTKEGVFRRTFGRPRLRWRVWQWLREEAHLSYLEIADATGADESTVRNAAQCQGWYLKRTA